MATFYFYEELNDFLRRARRASTLTVPCALAQMLAAVADGAPAAPSKRGG